MDENELERTLNGINYPASKIDVIAAAEANGAAQNVIESLQRLGAERFGDADAVRAALRDA